MLISHVLKAIEEAQNKKDLLSGTHSGTYTRYLLEPNTPLTRAASSSNLGAKKHGLEVAKLYLNQHPELSQKELLKPLYRAHENGNMEIVEMILESRSDWNEDSLKEIRDMIDLFKKK